MSDPRTLDDILKAARDALAKYPQTRANAFTNTDDFKAVMAADPIAAKKLISSDLWLFEAYQEVNARALAVFGRSITEVGHDLIRDRLAKMKEREAMILALDLSAPRCDLSDFIITETRGKRTTTKLDFCPVTDELVEAYGFDFRGVFNDIRNGATDDDVARFGFSEAEVNEGYRSSPLNGPLAAKVFCVLGFYADNLAPHIDHWHHLLDNDFDELRRGGTNYMALPSEDEDFRRDEHPIFAKIREIYALECTAASDGECLLFEVDW